MIRTLPAADLPRYRCPTTGGVFTPVRHVRRIGERLHGARIVTLWACCALCVPPHSKVRGEWHPNPVEVVS